MAYRVHTSSIGTDGVTSASIDLSDAWPSSQADGDMFIVAGINDGGGTAIGGFTGWTQIHLDGSSVSGTRSFAYYAIRSGSDITAPTLTGANDEWAIGVMVYRDVDTTTSLDATSAITQQTTNTQSPQCPTLTTATDNATILRIVTRDSTSCPRPSALLGQGAHVLTRTDNINSSNSNCSITAWESVQPTAGAAGTSGFIDIVNDGGVQMTIALRNASGGKVPAYPTTTPIETLLPLHTAPTATLLSALHPSPETILGRVCAPSGSAGGDVRNSGQAAASVASNMLLGYFAFIRTFGQTQTANTGLAGTYGAAYTLTATSDLSNALFVAAWTNSSSTLSNQIDNIGQAWYFRDTAGAWALWRPLTEAQNLRARSCCVHLPSETMVETGGGTIDWSQIERIGVAFPISGTTGTNSQREFHVYCLGRIPLTSGVANPLAICGGSSGKPLDSRDVAAALAVPYLTDLTSLQGAKQNLITFPLQIGDGTNPTFYDGSAGSTEFFQPSVLPPVRIPQDYVQYRIKAASGDSIRFGSQSVGSLRRQRLIIDPASSSGATHGFTGTVFNMAVSLDSDIPVANTTFTGCSEIDAAGATLTGVSIEASTSTDAAIAFSANGGIVQSTIDVTDTSCAFHIELGASVTTLDLTDTTLTGTPGTNQINILRTTGTVTITLAVGQTQPTYTTAGATVVFDQPIVQATASVTGFTADSRVIVYNVTTDTEVLNAKVAGTSWTLNYDNGTTFTDGDVVDVFHVFFDATGNTATKKTRTRTVASPSGWSVLVDEQTCTTYAAYVATFGVNGSTVTEFSLDGTNLQFDMNDPDNVWYAHRLFAFDKFEMWDTGNRAFFQQISAVDAGNLSIGSALLDNLSSFTAKQGDEINVVNSAGTLPVVNPTTGGGGITMYSGGKVLTTSTGGLAPNEAQIKSWVRAELATEMARIDATISSRNATAPDNAGIAAIKAKTDNLPADPAGVSDLPTVPAVIDANIVQVRGQAITGTGSESDPWGP